MLTNFHCFSINFESSDAIQRGRFSFSLDKLNDFVAIVKKARLGKCFILSTCNRTEIYIHSSQPKTIISAYLESVQKTAAEFYSMAKYFSGWEAINHLLRVSSGLESQVLGDFEIISQVKSWFKKFKDAGATDYLLERVVNHAIEVSKKVRSETKLSSGSTSIAFAAANFIAKNLSHIPSPKVLIIGTGKIGTNTCKNLIKLHPKSSITLMNRTLEKTFELVDKYNLSSLPYQIDAQTLALFDVIVTSTSSPHPIILPEHISRKNQTLIDLSIPQNINQAVGELKGISLINVDDLSKITRKTLEDRTSEIPKAEEIIQRHSEDLLIWLNHRKYAHALRKFKTNLSVISKRQIKKIQKENPSSSDIHILEAYNQKITNRLAEFLITHPEKADSMLDLLDRIFQMEESSERKAS